MIRSIARTRAFGFVISACAAACSSASSGGATSNGNTVALMAGFDPGPAPDPSKGFQVITPIVTDVAAAESYEYCTYTDVVMSQDTWVNASREVQTESGHHVIFYYTMNHVTPGTHLCTNAEMTDFQFAMPAGTKGQTLTLPGDLAVKIPKGAQIVVNHHYLNASASTIAQAQSAIDVYYADQSVPHTPASLMVVLDSELTVPKGSSTYTVSCTVNQTYGAWAIVPHMHNWGTHITVDDTPASGGAAQRLFDLDWKPDYAFDFEAVAITKSPTAPLVFHAGDKIQITCDYLNDTSSTLTFGDEMCLLVNFTVDPDNVGNVQCDRGTWGKF
jgi:hypothetical protein